MQAEATTLIECASCGARLYPDERFCVECGARQDAATATGDSARATAGGRQTESTALVTSAPRDLIEFEEVAPYPLVFATVQPARQSRLKTFFRFLLAIPAVIVLMIFEIAALFCAVLAWFAILVTGRYPRGLWNFNAGVVVREAMVGSYTLYLRDEYPPFSLDGEYPILFELPYPERSSRLATFFRYLLAIPNIVVLAILSYALVVTLPLVWLCVVIGGRQPGGLWRFHQGMVRWSLRLRGYVLMLTDRYPPFSFGNAEPSPDLSELER